MKTQKKWLLPVLSCMGMMGTISTAQAAVTVYWEQDGADVIASWSGTLDLDPLIGTSTLQTDDRDEAIAPGLYHLSGGVNGYYFNSLFSAGSPNFASGLGSAFESPSGESHASFGFRISQIFYNDVHVSGGMLGAVSQLSFDPTRDVIRFSGMTLAGMSAGGFLDTLAWTAATTGDTISYTTGPVPVPEPSSALLVGLGTLALFARRKR